MDVEFTEKLIQEVRNRPILYLLNHKDYKNNTKKLQAWGEIQVILNEEVPALKAKWKNLKDTYRKFKQSRSTNSSQAVKKLQNWAWADHMSFIESFVTLSEVESNIAPPVPANIVSNSVLHNVKSDSRQESGVTGNQNTQQRHRKQRKDKLNPKRMAQYLQNRPKNRNPYDKRVGVKCDGTDLLFLGYADTFKKLSKRKQVSVKFNIARLLMEAELDDLNTPQRSSVSSDTHYSLIKADSPDPDSYLTARTIGNYNTEDNSLTNATSADIYVQPLTPSNCSMIKDETINDVQDNTDQ